MRGQQHVYRWGGWMFYQIGLGDHRYSQMGEASIRDPEGMGGVDLWGPRIWCRFASLGNAIQWAIWHHDNTPNGVLRGFKVVVKLPRFLVTGIVHWASTASRKWS